MAVGVDENGMAGQNDKVTEKLFDTSLHRPAISKRIGLLGGTFDPPHAGHLRLAQSALEQLELDEVRWLPVGDPTHKNRPDLSSINHRVAMTVLATQHTAAYALDLTDITRPEPHFTSTLLPFIQAQHPNAQLWLVIGGDSLRDFHKWHEPKKIIQMCRLAVLPRPSAEINWDALAHIPLLRERVDMLDGATLAISSTQLRKNIDTAPAIDHVSNDVHSYITSRQLYNLQD